MLNKLSIAIKTANQKSFLRKTALLTTSAATLAMMSMVPGVSAQEGAAPVEEIMITGIRGALKTAIDVKRNSEAVVDAISSEDIGKMPDKNVADSLSRVPGVQIQKGLTGEGSRVAIRGTDPELTYAVLNGQQVATTDWFVLAPQGRSFNFDLMPSEMVKGLEVYKSPMARLTEGGVGGTVIMNTRRPLELDANTFYASVEGNYTDLADESNASFGGLGSWKNSSETFGILAAVSSNKEAGIGNRGENYMSWGAGSAHFAQERERLALDVTAQFAPVEGLDIVAHYFSTETTADNTNHNFLLIPGRSTLVTASADGQSGSVIDSGGDPIWQNDIFYRQSEIKSDLFDLDAKYEGEGYTLHGQVGTTDSTGGTQLEAGAGFTDRTSASWDTSGNSVNLVPVTAIDTANMEWFSGSLSRTPREAEHTYGQFDVLFDTELGAVKSLETGIRATTYEYTKDKYAGTTPTTATHPALATTVAGDFGDGIVSGLQPEAGGSPNSYQLVNMSKLTNFYLEGAEFTQDRSGYGQVSEDTQSAYVQANFEEGSISGNFGVRYANTETTGTAYDPSLTDKMDETHEYSEFLPSFNVKFDLSDDVVVRASAARVMSRPSYANLDTSYSGVNNTLFTASQGNVNIDPFLANQFDFGAEWYFSEASMLSGGFFYKDIGSFVTTTTITKFIPDSTTPGDYQVQVPVNGQGGSIEGIELQYQQDFGNGFGLNTNFTYSDGEGIDNTGKAVDLPGNSKTSYNLTGYYENELFSVRLSYNWRDSFLAPGLSLGNQSFSESQGFLDASATWHVVEHVDLYASATNLTNEVRVDRSATGGLVQTNENGSRYYVGARFKF